MAVKSSLRIVVTYKSLCHPLEPHITASCSELLTGERNPHALPRGVPARCLRADGPGQLPLACGVSFRRTANAGAQERTEVRHPAAIKPESTPRRWPRSQQRRMTEPCVFGSLFMKMLSVLVGGSPILPDSGLRSYASRPGGAGSSEPVEQRCAPDWRACTALALFLSPKHPCIQASLHPPGPGGELAGGPQSHSSLRQNQGLLTPPPWGPGPLESV